MIHICVQGGYNLTSISNSMCVCAAVLLGDTSPLLETRAPNERYRMYCMNSTWWGISQLWLSSFPFRWP